MDVHLSRARELAYSGRTSASSQAHWWKAGEKQCVPLTCLRYGEIVMFVEIYILTRMDRCVRLL